MKFTLGFILVLTVCVLFVTGSPIYEQNPQPEHGDDHVQETGDHQLETATATPSPSPMSEEEGELVKKALLRYFRTINDALAEYTKRIATEVEVHYPDKNEVHPEAR